MEYGTFDKPSMRTGVHVETQAKRDYKAQIFQLAQQLADADLQLRKHKDKKIGAESVKARRSLTEAEPAACTTASEEP